MLSHLAELARLELSEKESEKFLGDLGKILDHFKELENLDTKNIVPMTGGTMLKNIFREDGSASPFENPNKIVEAFPEKEGRYNKIPPVFN